MRFHEALLCVVAMFAPVTAVIVWPYAWVPLAVFVVVSLPLIRFVGWLIDTTYSH